jgi:undecaprenyl-diphosphatase
MDTWLILVLAIVQGLAELLPISSSAHVIAVMKFLKEDPGSPKMTFLLIMLHTGTMFAVIVYFWNRWRARLWPQDGLDLNFVGAVVIATLVTGVLGFGLKQFIEKIVLEKFMGHDKGEVEHLFRSIPLIATSLTLVGLLILAAGFTASDWGEPRTISRGTSLWIGLIQGLCLPFRGFSRSGATISVGLFRGLSRTLSEEYSFALAVVLTPPLVLYEAWRLFRGGSDDEPGKSLDTQGMMQLLSPGLLGMVFAFLAGLVALKLLSALLENGRWSWFGVYCLGFAALLFTGSAMGWL